MFSVLNIDPLKKATWSLQNHLQETVGIPGFLLPHEVQIKDLFG